MKKLLLLVGALVALNVVLFGMLGSKRSEESSQKLEEASEKPEVGFRLQWDRSPDPRIVEYRIYVATDPGSYTFDKPTAVVPADVTEWLVSGLPPGSYFAVVTAASGREESAPTEEIEFTLR